MTDTDIFTHWMQCQGLSNSKAAAALGVDISTIKRIKRGLIPIPKERRLAMAAIAAKLPEYSKNYQLSLVTLQNPA